MPGFVIMTRGIRIKPPPPTTASTHPAAREPRKRIVNTVADKRSLSSKESESASQEMRMNEGVSTGYRDGLQCSVLRK